MSSLRSIAHCCIFLLLLPWTISHAQSQDANIVYQTSQPWHKRLFVRSQLHKKTNTEAANLWQVVQQNVQLDTASRRKAVQTEIRWYANNKSYLQRTFNRADPYLYHIVNELQKRNLPLGLAVLPIVESAYDPFAFSHGGAAGLWQLMPTTAKHFGVEQNWWYDGRRDLYDSTTAALDYLAYLGRFFNDDWALALAAYNAGEGTVQRAMQRNKRLGLKTDFWSLQLPKETQTYVPRILALAEIISNPSRIDLELPYVPNAPVIDWVELEHQIDLGVASKLANISLSDLYKLNPGYNHWSTAPDGPHRLFLPVDATAGFLEQVNALAPEERINWTRYTIQSGDSLSSIAQRHQTTVGAIQSLNGLNTNQIKAGSHIFVPSLNISNTDYDFDIAQFNFPRTYYSEQEIAYTVKAGDSLWKIAKSHNVSINQLRSWNGLTGEQYLRPGQKLKLYQNMPYTNKQSSSPEIVRKINYRVRRGDSINKIAQRFHVSSQEINQWNGLSKNHNLKPGEQLIVYVDVTKQSI